MVSYLNREKKLDTFVGARPIAPIAPKGIYLYGNVGSGRYHFIDHKLSEKLFPLNLMLNLYQFNVTVFCFHFEFFSPKARVLLSKLCWSSETFVLCNLLDTRLHYALCRENNANGHVLLCHRRYC